MLLQDLEVLNNVLLLDKMVIEEKDFRLIPINNNSVMFDLELLFVVKPKDKDPRLEFKNVAYGINLETALKKIAHYRVYNNNSENSITLANYLKEFKSELENIRNLCITD